ncbi:hypothetical protein [Stenotrophomonas bentonitica]|uniref:hypothetical protein n=1 Tax=Stenotrophomonas bentonitica TaxID=1450134 RepID=UPI00345EBB67
MPIINTKLHTFAQALACKADNLTLSRRSISKLTDIANRQFGGSAGSVFGSDSRRFTGNALALGSAISSQLNTVRSPAMKELMGQWLGRLSVPLAQAGSLGTTRFGHRDLTPVDKPPAVMAWLATTARFSAQWSGQPAPPIASIDHPKGEGAAPAIPRPDYDDAPVKTASSVVIPPVDYDDAPSVAIPEVDYDDAPAPRVANAPLAESKGKDRHVRFSDSDEVHYLTAEESREPR